MPGPTLPLWTSQTSGERLTTWGVTLILRRMGDRAGVHVHPHMLRRTFAIASLRAGMDVARVAALLGHTDLAAVQGYLAIVDSRPARPRTGSTGRLTPAWASENSSGREHLLREHSRPTHHTR